MWKLVLSLPKIFDVLEKLLDSFLAAIAYYEKKQNDKEIDDAAKEPDRKKAASDLDNVFRS